MPDREKKCLTEDQARHIYKKVEMDKSFSIETITLEIEDGKMTRNRFKEEEDENDSNPSQMAILNKKSKDNTKIEQMINWSIFSDLIKYVDRSSCSDVIPSLTVKPLDDRKNKRLYNSLKIDENLTADIIFQEDRVRDAYLHKYDGIHAEISQATRFNESTDLSTMYLGKTGMTREHVFKAEEKFPISRQGYTNGKLLDHTECSILIDTGASKSYMSKSYYMQCKSLHALSKFVLTTQRVQVGNGQYVAVLFVIPVIIDIHGHRFEVFTLVSEIHDNVDLELGMKNVFELEGVIGMWDSSFKFLNRSLPLFSKEQVVVKPKEQRFIKIEAAFVDEMTGLAIVKMLDNKEQCMVVLKFIRN